MTNAAILFVIMEAIVVYALNSLDQQAPKHEVSSNEPRGKEPASYAHIHKREVPEEILEDDEDIVDDDMGGEVDEEATEDELETLDEDGIDHDIKDENQTHLGDDDNLYDDTIDDREGDELRTRHNQQTDQSRQQQSLPPDNDNPLPLNPEAAAATLSVESKRENTQQMPMLVRVNSKLLAQEEKDLEDLEKKINTSLEYALRAMNAGKPISWSETKSEPLIAPLEVDDSIFEENSRKMGIPTIVLLCIIMCILFKFIKVRTMANVRHLFESQPVYQGRMSNTSRSSLPVIEMDR
ncbi:hypothetical protein EC973_002612 [Apophysomyces ossiformis]|uniref:Uncharacterized protein n=1 Tax=Apophysomyces ossiformis TaxID=679940 RepID=A0A8H7BIV5_9FUNG|nr:hypothetical protein EC973_002612 [Apophysomyces ossiformis]